MLIWGWWVFFIFFIFAEIVNLMKESDFFFLFWQNCDCFFIRISVFCVFADIIWQKWWFFLCFWGAEVKCVGLVGFIFSARKGRTKNDPNLGKIKQFWRSGSKNNEF